MIDLRKIAIWPEGGGGAAPVPEVEDGKAFFFVRISEDTGPLRVIAFSPNDSAELDWGDGSDPVAFGDRAPSAHEYAQPGEYQITITVEGDEVCTLGYTAGGALFTNAYVLERAFIGAGFKLNQGIFSGNIRLETFHTNVYGTAPIDLCNSCFSLNDIEVPRFISFGTNAFYKCPGPTRMRLSGANLGAQAFRACSIVEFDFGKTTAINVGASALYDDNHVNVRYRTYIFRNPTPPTLTGAISNVKRILVPAESVDAYKAATNWSAYADRIFPIPDTENE